MNLIQRFGWDRDSVVTGMEDVDVCRRLGFPPLHETAHNWASGHNKLYTAYVSIRLGTSINYEDDVHAGALEP